MELNYFETCHEGVARRGIYQPCAKTAVAMHNDPETGDPYPVCGFHARGDMVSLVSVLREAGREAREAIPAVILEVTQRVICPECAQGKHRNCTGWVLDADDNYRVCGCSECQ